MQLWPPGLAMTSRHLASACPRPGCRRSAIEANMAVVDREFTPR